MKKKALVVLLVVVTLLSVVAVGCSSSVTVKGYIEAQRAQLDDLIESVKDEAEMSIYDEGNTIVFSYKYKTDVGDVETAGENMKATESALKAGADAIKAELKIFGINDSAVKYIYINSDGTEIYSKTF